MVGFKDTLDMISLDALVIFVNAWVLIALGIRHPIAPWLHVLASVAMGQGPGNLDIRGRGLVFKILDETVYMPFCAIFKYIGYDIHGERLTSPSLIRNRRRWFGQITRVGS